MVFGLIFVFIFASNKIFLVSGYDKKLGTFKNLHRHNKLRSCGAEVLKENSCVGGRVHELTGGCECLNHSWGINQTIQEGYAYTIKSSAEDIFIPPINFKEKPRNIWTIPGVLREGAKVELTVTAGAGDFNFAFFNSLDGLNTFSLTEVFPPTFVAFSVEFANLRPDVAVVAYEIEGGKSIRTRNEIPVKQFSPVAKLSYTSLSDRWQTVWVRVDDQTLFRGNITVDPMNFKHVALTLATESKENRDVTKIHRFRFIDG